MNCVLIGFSENNKRSRANPNLGKRESMHVYMCAQSNFILDEFLWCHLQMPAVVCEYVAVPTIAHCECRNFLLNNQKKKLKWTEGAGSGERGIAVILQQKSVTVLTSTKVCHCFLCNFLDYTQFKVVY